LAILLSIFKIEKLIPFFCSNNSWGPARLQSVMQLQTVRSWELQRKNGLTF